MSSKSNAVLSNILITFTCYSRSNKIAVESKNEMWNPYCRDDPSLRSWSRAESKGCKGHGSAKGERVLLDTC